MFQSKYGESNCQDREIEVETCCNELKDKAVKISELSYFRES